MCSNLNQIEMYLDILHAIGPKIDIDALWFYLQLIVHFVLDKKD